MSGSTRSYEFARRLVKNGHEVHMISLDRSGTRSRSLRCENIEGIQVHWIGTRYSHQMNFYQRLYAFMSFAVLSSYRAMTLKADLVFATSAPLTIAIPAMLASKTRRIPLVFEIRDVWPAVPIALGVLKSGFAIRLARWLERAAYFSSERVIVVAPGMADEVAQTGYDPHRIAVIPHGCDLDLFRSTDTTEVANESLREIVYFGTLGPANGVDYIVKLAAAVQSLCSENEGVGVRFTIIGQGRMMQAIRDLAEELDVLGKCLFMLPDMPKNQVVAHVRRADATIMTYTGPEILYRDSVSNKFFDSLAARKPIFANFRGFSTLTAEAFGAGKILPSDDIQLAARQLLMKLDDRDFMDSALIACDELAQNHFSRDRLYQDFESVLFDGLQREKPTHTVTGQTFIDLWRSFHTTPEPLIE